MGKTAAGVRDSWRHRIPVGHSSSDQPINLFRRLDLCLTNTHDFQVTPLKTLKFNTYNNTYFYDPVVLRAYVSSDQALLEKFYKRAAKVERKHDPKQGSG